MKTGSRDTERDTYRQARLRSAAGVAGRGGWIRTNGARYPGQSRMRSATSPRPYMKSRRINHFRTMMYICCCRRL